MSQADESGATGMVHPHVQIVLENGPVPPVLESALRRIHATASFRAMSEAIRSGLAPTADALVIIETGADAGRRERRMALLGQVARQPRATLVLTDDASLDMTGENVGPVPLTIGRSMNVDELAGRLAAMVSMRRSLETLWHDSTQARRAAHQVQERYQEQLRLAGQLQRDLMVACPPRFGPVELTPLFRTANAVSGDFYDIRKLDERHVAISIADAAGCSVSAALLTVFLRRGMNAWHGADGGIRQPHELLSELNTELLAAELTECPYVAACCTRIDLETLRVEIARAGTPMPTVRRSCGECTLVDGGGMVLGVAENAQLETQIIQLAAGDALLLNTDGLECAADFGASSRCRSESGACREHCDATDQETSDSCESAGCCEIDGCNLDTSLDPRDTPPGASWLRRVQRDGVAEVIAQAAARYDLLRRLGRTMDDMTLVGLTVAG